MYKVKKDGFSRARGGNSRVLDISCAHCGNHVAYYQKDGPGTLKRMYADRFIGSEPKGGQLTCSNCDRKVGTLFTYKKENRAAYRLHIGAVSKKIADPSDLP